MRRIIAGFGLVVLSVSAATAVLAANTPAVTPTNYCAASSIEICGQQINVPQQAAAGDTVQVVVPPDYLGKAYKKTPVALMARCDIVNGAPQYRTANPAGMSCNIFLCQPATLSACNSQVDISRTAELGETFKASSMNGEPITVECRGSGTIPQYVITATGCGE